MGILRLFRRLNCFGSGQGKQKSKRHMEEELRSMQETLRRLELDIHTKRNTVEFYKRQRAAEEKKEMIRNTRTHLMAQIEQIESRLRRVLEKRQKLMSGIIECNIHKMVQEQKMETRENTEENFVKNDFNQPTPDLRRVRSMNDMDKAVLQPPLC